MSKKRLLSGAVIAAVARGGRMLATTVTASAKPAAAAATPSSSGSSRSSRWTSTSRSSNAAKKWDKATPGAKVIYASGKSGTDDAGEIAAIQNMVAQGVKGIAITPTSPAVSAALDKAIKAGVKVVLMDNDIPTWKKKSSVVATNNFKGGQLAGQVPRQAAQGRRHARHPRGQSRHTRRSFQRVTGMLSGLGAMKSKIKVVSKLETDCDQTKGATAAQTILTANPSLTAIYSACGPPALGAIQSIKNAGIKPGEIILVGFDASPDEVKAIKAGTENAQRGAVPGQDRRRSASRRCGPRSRARRCRRTSTRARRS